MKTGLITDGVDGIDDGSSGSPSVDSTTHNDLDSLNIPSVDMKTKYDIESTLERLDSKLDATYGLVNSANSCESGSGSKGSDEGVLDGMEGVEDSVGMEGVEDLDSRLNEQSVRGSKSEGQGTTTPDPGCTTDPVQDAGQQADTAVKTDLDAPGKVDSDSSNRDVDASSGYGSGSPPGIVIQKGPIINSQAGDNVSGYPSSTKCDTPEQSGCVPKLSPGSLNSPSNVCASKSKIITNLSGGKPQHCNSEREHLNGMIRQGPQNVTVCGPNRMDPRTFQGSGMYPPRQPHPRGMSPPFMGMPQGSPLSSGNNSPMSPHNTMSPPQVNDPSTGSQPAGYSSPPLQGNYPYNSAQYNQQMSSHPMSMPSMNGQGFPNQNTMRGPHVQQGPRPYGSMPMGSNTFYPQGRPVRSPQGMPSFPQGAYAPQGYPPHGHPQQPNNYTHQQTHTGYGNQYQMPQHPHKGMGTYTGNYQAPNMHQYNGQNPGQFAAGNMGAGQNNAGYQGQNFGQMNSVGSSMPGHTPGQVLRPGGNAGPAVQQGPGGAGGPSPVRMEGGFPSYHGNSLTHFPAGEREVSSSGPAEPSPSAGGPSGNPAGEGSVPQHQSHDTTNTTASNIVNSQQLIAMNRRFGNNINNNFVHPSQVNPNLQVQSQQVQSLPGNPLQQQQYQQGNRPTLGSQQQMYVNHQQGQTMPYNSQYTTYTNNAPQQQNPAPSTPNSHGNCETTNNNSLSSTEGEDSIPEFSMFGEYAPQSEFY